MPRLTFYATGCALNCCRCSAAGFSPRWTKACSDRGNDRYGRLWYEGKIQLAHRVAYMLAGDVILPGEVIMHSCDNPPCCNPAHLSAGTHADNKDMRTTDDDRLASHTERGEGTRCKAGTVPPL